MAGEQPSNDHPSAMASELLPSTSRFTSQASTTEDILSSQTVGLFHLSDFRKRRAEALEQKEREATQRSYDRVAPPSGGASGEEGPKSQPTKKKRKGPSKGKLSFAVDEEGDVPVPARKAAVSTLESREHLEDPPGSESGAATPQKRLVANKSLAHVPKAMTKAALLQEAQTREQLRKEFLVLQEAIKATEIAIPFVFYDGTNIPGGLCKVKKGDHIWVFLDRSRKLGAELGVGGDKTNRRTGWARIGVDDLLLVRGEIIIPHHYDFYYFIVNKTLGHSAQPLFDYSAQPTAQTRSAPDPLAPVDLSSYDPLSRPLKSSTEPDQASVAQLEGYNDDPNLTKVVDRRWYERNKHIFPASVWEDFDPSKDYSKGMRRDAQGNAFFFR